MYSFTNPDKVYYVGKELTLFPYEPVRPHGSGQYKRNPLPPTLPRGHVRDFDTTADYSDTQAKVTINKEIDVDWNRRFQIVSCKVTRFPREEASTEQQEPLSEMKNNQRINLERELVLRICDVEYAPSDLMAPCSDEELAEGDFSRDYWAMRHFHQKGITGVGYLGPHFYGGWVAMVCDEDHRGESRYRYVYVSIIERVYGCSVDDLCFRSEPGNEGWLIPHKSPTGFKEADGSIRWITFNQKTRHEVMKLALHGLVVSMNNSVEHHGFGPEAAFITFRDGDKDLDKMRVVHLGHDRTQVWRFTATALDESEFHCLEQLPHPPHPCERFCWEALADWHCWIANKEKFEKWLTDENSFGPHEDARDQLAELGPGAEWPHKYAMYSTFARLDEIENDGCKRVVVAPLIASYLDRIGDLETLQALCLSSVMAVKSREKWIAKLAQGSDDVYKKLNDLVLK